MSSRFDDLVACSLQAALSSIEIYNKPDFRYREQVFTMLNVNAWELLLKARVLQLANDNLNALYIALPDGKYKTNRSGNPMTIDIIAAMNRLSLNPAVCENINTLVGIRDTATHFYHSSSLSYLVYTLAVASLKNYQKLMKEWFAKSLLEYNFYILPLSFAFNFRTLTLIELEKEPEAVANL